MACTMFMAAIFMIASAVVQSSHCSSGGMCASDDVPNNVASLLQTKLHMDALKHGGEDLNVGPATGILSSSSQENAAGQPLHPKVLELIQYHESLERGRSSLLAETVQAADPPASGIETLFIVLSDSKDYSTNLRWISDSWGKNLSSLQLLAIADEPKGKSTKMRVEQTKCEAHTLYGACCKTAEAIITAHQMLEKQPNLKWAYIVEDDSYLRPEAIDKRLKTVDPDGAFPRGTLVAMPGCNFNKCPGVCGSGGMALNREALTTLVGDSPSKFLTEFMQNCHTCMMHGGVTTGTLANAHNINIFTQWQAMEMHGWILPQHVFEDSLIGEPVMYHPMKREGQFKFLDQLFAEQHKSAEDPRDAQLFAEQHKSADDLRKVYCAKYNGNTVCTSDRDACPFKPI